MRLVSLFSVLCCIVAISACAPKVYAPVEERSVETERQEIQRFGGHLVRFVKPGDTLYGIAFESNLSVRKLAAWNGINNYRSLKVGQRLRLTKPYGFVEKKRKSQLSRPVVIAKTNSKKPGTNKPALKPNKKAVAKSVAKTTGASSRKTKQASPTKTTAKAVASKWVWPVDGKVLRTFSPQNGRQGIDISVLQGKAVVASRAGEVVYVGSSLKGYGKLVIIKHEGDFLSAYAHNKKILVKEGQVVNIQQRIGTSGLNNRNESALQFQIRIDGNSVNPLPYLNGRK